MVILHWVPMFVTPQDKPLKPLMDQSIRPRATIRMLLQDQIRKLEFTSEVILRQLHTAN